MKLFFHILIVAWHSDRTSQPPNPCQWDEQTYTEYCSTNILKEAVDDAHNTPVEIQNVTYTYSVLLLQYNMYQPGKKTLPSKANFL